MRSLFMLAWWIFILLCSCSKADRTQNEDYPLISYLDIAVDSMGNLPETPYVIDLANNGRRLIIIGTQHSRDSLNPMYQEMEQIFYDVEPEVIINEGGDLNKTYFSLNEAIAKDSDLGFDKYLADKAGIRTVNGDEPQRQEFEELSEAYSKEEALVYYAAERFIFPYIFQDVRKDFVASYEEYTANLVRYDSIPLSPAEQQFSYFQNTYNDYFDKKFDINELERSFEHMNQLDFIPFSTAHHFNEVSRTSKELRDKYLLRTIEEQLYKHDKVMVVYGGWHVLAIEPALTQIIERVE